MRRLPARRLGPAILVGVALLSCASSGPARFPDTPILWRERDDAHVARSPKASDWERQRVTSALEDFLFRPIDRRLAVETWEPARDVNALDEVPCSTWFCPRNHLSPLSLDEIAAGPPGFAPPEPPFTILSGKFAGASPGYFVRDAAGREYLLKLDPPGHAGLQSGAEAVGARLFHAMGYHVPNAWVVDLRAEDLRIAPGARARVSPVREVSLTVRKLRTQLAAAGRLPDGRHRAVAVAILPGEPLGAFAYQGTRADDPNDRIPHEHRRSLRASFVAFAWLNMADAGHANTLATFVEEEGRQFVKHWQIDFGGGLGSWTTVPKHVVHGGERWIDVERTVSALFSFGAHERPWQSDREARDRAVAARPAIGYLRGSEWNPDEFRTMRPNAAHQRMTPADAYFGAKLVASIRDEQLRAAVSAGRYAAEDAAYLVDLLRTRRDAVARRWLLPFTAVESPAVDPSGRLCFRDLAIELGYAKASDTTYTLAVRGVADPGEAADDRPAAHAHPAADELPADGPATCVGLARLAPWARAGYAIVTIAARRGGATAKPAHVHLRHRARERRWVVVGLVHGDPPAGGPVANAAARSLRVLLTPARYVVQAASWPLLATTSFAEEQHLYSRYVELLTTDDGRIGARPELGYSSTYGFTYGARYFDRRTLGEGSRLLFRVRGNGSRNLWLEARARAGNKALARLEGSLVAARNDHLVFGGISGESAGELARMGLEPARYSAQSLHPRADATFLLGRARLDGFADGILRDYGDGESPHDPPISQVYDVATIPGFDGMRLFRAGATLTFEADKPVRRGRLLASVGAAYAEGFAGDPSRHVTVLASVGNAFDLDHRWLHLRLRAGMVEPLGAAPVPFEELRSPTGVAGLRGIDEGRLRGHSDLVATVEYRWMIAPFLDASVFVDVGGAFGPHFDDADWDELIPSYGFALRAFRWRDRGDYLGAGYLGAVQLAAAPDEGLVVLFSTDDL